MPLQARVLDRLTALTEWARRGTIRLAVTGLSQSGKTAFITSLVQNLLSAAEQSARLPFLHASAERRILSVRLVTPEDVGPPRFPLRETVTALAADPPRWPASTTDLRRLLMSLEFLPTGLLGRGPEDQSAGTLATSVDAAGPLCWQASAADQRRAR